MAGKEPKSMTQILKDRGINPPPAAGRADCCCDNDCCSKMNTTPSSAKAAEPTPKITFPSVVTARQEDFAIPGQYLVTDEGRADVQRAAQRHAARRAFDELREREEKLERDEAALRASGQLVLF